MKNFNDFILTFLWGVIPPVIRIGLTAHIWLKHISVNRFNVIFAFLAVVLSLLVSSSITHVINSIAIGLIILLPCFFERRYPKNLPLRWAFLGIIISYMLGFIFGVGNFEGEMRLSFILNDVNFSAFFCGTFVIILYKQGRFKEALALFLIILLISLSRSFMLSIVAVISYFALIDNFKMIFKIRNFLFLLLFFFLLTILFQSISLDIVTGYQEGAVRLFTLFDGSSIERFENIINWTSLIFSKTSYMILGLPENVYLNADSNFGLPHNSFVERAAKSGIVSLLIFILVAFATLPIGFVIYFMIWGMLLHGIFSFTYLFTLLLVLNYDFLLNEK